MIKTRSMNFTCSGWILLSAQRLLFLWWSFSSSVQLMSRGLSRQNFVAADTTSGVEEKHLSSMPRSLTIEDKGPSFDICMYFKPQPPNAVDLQNRRNENNNLAHDWDSLKSKQKRKICFSGIVQGDKYVDNDILISARTWLEDVLHRKEDAVDPVILKVIENDRHNGAADFKEVKTRNLPPLSKNEDLSSNSNKDRTFTSVSLTNGRRKLAAGEEEERENLGASAELMNIIMALVCVCVAALAAGLTMGMVSIEPLQLLIKIRVGTPSEKKHAQALLPLVQQHHRLLVTLLLCNSIANEALPLFLDKLVPGYVAVIISVSLVLVFGEILPSAIFTGPNQIPMAAAMAPPVRAIMFALSPIAYPIAKMLDYFLGHDESHYVGDAYNRGELSALVRVIYEEQARKKKELKTTMMLAAANKFSSYRNTSLTKSQRGVSKLLATDLGLSKSEDSTDLSRGGSGHPAGALQGHQFLHLDEVAMVEGALSMKTKTAKDVYQPMEKVFAVPEETVLDEETMAEIYNSGHSRIPVYECSSEKLDNESDTNEQCAEEQKKKIKSVLLSRNLIVVDSNDNRPVNTLPLLQPHCVSPNKPLVDLINDFQALGPNVSMAGHLAIVCEDPELANSCLSQSEAIPAEANVLGIVTLEDVIEELLQEEIVDESDKREYKAMQSARKAFDRWKSFVRGKKVQRAAQQEAEVERVQERIVAAIEEAAAKAALTGVSNADTIHVHVNIENNSPQPGVATEVGSDVIVDVISAEDDTPLLHATASSVSNVSASGTSRRGKKDRQRRSYGAV